jgi:hypothetical protein
MISFCDIPLSLAKQHISKYGKFAIGLSKEWGITNRLNPVLYIESNSIIANDINNSRKEFSNMSKTLVEHVTSKKFFPKSLVPVLHNIIQTIYTYRNTLRFIKNYQGTLVRGKKKYLNYRFYDEREWRYVPEINDTRIKSYIKDAEYQTYRGTSKAKPFLREINIEFKAKDIKYLIVESNNDIPRLIKAIKSANNLVANSAEADILATKIITIEQLNNDF